MILSFNKHYMLTSHDIQEFRRVNDSEHIDYNEAVGVVQARVRELTTGAMDITYE